MNTKIKVTCYEPSEKPQGGLKTVGLEKIFDVDQKFTIESPVKGNGKIIHDYRQNYVTYERVENGVNCSTKYFLSNNTRICKKVKSQNSNKLDDELVFVLRTYSEPEKIKVMQRRI